MKHFITSLIVLLVVTQTGCQRDRVARRGQGIPRAAAATEVVPTNQPSTGSADAQGDAARASEGTGNDKDGSNDDDDTSGDGSDVSNQGQEEGTQAWRDFTGIIRAKCVSCHAAFGRYESADAWVAAGYVVRADPARSRVYNRLKGSNSGAADQRTMPAEGTPLSEGEIGKVRTFIESLTTATDTARVETADDRRQAAFAVLQSKCAGCHTVPRIGIHPSTSGVAVATFGNFTTDAQFAQSGLIEPGNAASSWIYSALKTFGTIQSMPKNTTNAISADDAQKIQRWIEGLLE